MTSQPRPRTGSTQNPGAGWAPTQDRGSAPGLSIWVFSSLREGATRKMDQKAQTTQLLENLRGLRLGHRFPAVTPKAQALKQIKLDFVKN